MTTPRTTEPAAPRWRRRSPRTHRTFPALLSLIVVAVAMTGLTACGDDAASESGSGKSDDAGAPSGAWTFTDDRGIDHALDEVPDVVAAQSVSAGGLWEYGIDVDGVFGPLRRPDGSTDPALGLADPDDFESLGEVDSEINLEAMAAMQPDIIVTAMWGEDSYWGIDDTQIDQIELIAPVVGIRVDGRPIDEVLARYAELAESLDGDRSKIDDARTEFEEASESLRTTLESKPGLQVVAASGTPAEMYVAYPPGFPELNYYQSLDMDLVVPEEHPTSNGFWETLSWEQAGKYPADVLLADARGGTIDQILGLLPAAAKGLPAVEAGQIYTWPTVQAYGYGAVAKNISALKTSLSTASTDVA